MRPEPALKVVLAFVGLLFIAGIHPELGAARNRPPAQDASGTQILFLGTNSGPTIHVDRSEPSTLLIVDGHQYLIDCGIGTLRRTVEAGVQSEQIRTIFLTHLHPDHDLGLADVMSNDFYRLNRANSADTINIYGPPQTKALVDAAFEYIAIPFRVFAAEPIGNSERRIQESIRSSRSPAGRHGFSGRQSSSDCSRKFALRAHARGFA
jgi:ribonuclease BN (tRNA processing enzyme)